MSGCCAHEGEALALARAARRRDIRRVLIIVLAINSAMFFLEFGAGLVAHSAALMADSVDMLGDAMVYGLSLYALGRSARWKAGAATAKGLFILVFGSLWIMQNLDYNMMPVHQMDEYMIEQNKKGF